MSVGEHIKVWPTVLLLAGTVVLADIPEQYRTILDRNPFGLNPPPPPAPVDSQNTPQGPANIKLTGFSTFSALKKAYFVILSKDPKDPKGPQQYVSLAEGERDGLLEVLKIKDETGEVQIRNAGMESTLSLTNNNMAGNTAPKLAPGMTAVPNQPPPGQPAAQPVSTVFDPAKAGGVVAGFNTPPQPGQPIQPGMQPGALPSIQPSVPGMPTPSVPSGIRTIPTRTLRGPSTPVPPSVSPQGAVGGNAIPVAFNNHPSSRLPSPNWPPETVFNTPEEQRAAALLNEAAGLNPPGAPPPPY